VQTVTLALNAVYDNMRYFACCIPRSDLFCFEESMSSVTRILLMYVHLQKMERDITPYGSKPENQRFLSPVLELTQSLQSLSTTR